MKFYRTTPFQKIMYPSAAWKTKSEDAIYLTFDDGPTPKVTPWVLDELDKVEGKASFFCIGRNLEAHKHIAADTLRRGHVLGNHTNSHLNGFKVESDGYLKDIEGCDEQLELIGGNSGLFRPPYGRIRRKQLDRLTQKKVVMWSYLSWDFSSRFNAKHALKALKKASAGDIVLFHDSEKAFENLKQILPQLLAHYRTKGLKLEALK